MRRSFALVLCCFALALSCASFASAGLVGKERLVNLPGFDLTARRAKRPFL